MNDVDLPYFQAVIAANDYPEDIHWYISYYSDSEKDKLLKVFRSHISSDTSKLTMFKLEDLLVNL